MTIKKDTRPLSLQVMDRIKKDIESGVYATGVRLPSEAELSRQLGVSRATLREALRLLEDEKIVIRRHGIGTFVHSKPICSGGISELFSVTDAIERHGYQPGTVLVGTGFREPTEDERRQLSLPQEAAVLAVERVRTANGEPVVYCVDRMPADLFPGGFRPERESLFDLLESSAGIRIAHAVAHIEPVVHHELASSLLRCPPKMPLLLLKQVHYDEKERAVLYSHNYFRADKFHFHVVRRRP